MQRLIGFSELNRPIYAYYVGSKGKKILITAAIHAREYITSVVAKKMIRYYEMLKINAQLVFVPYSNIDGILLATCGLCSVKSPQKREFLLQVNNGSSDFSLFKANANAVDLNTNFPANFGSSKSNLFIPSSANYVGKFPLSERENQAIANLVKCENFDYALCLHSKGEVIYWKFFQEENLQRDRRIGCMLANESGYSLIDDYSSGGLKDFLIQTYKIPCYTIEVGCDNLAHPISEYYADSIFNRIKDLPQILVNA